MHRTLCLLALCTALRGVPLGAAEPSLFRPTVTLNAQNEPLATVLDQIRDQTGLLFAPFHMRPEGMGLPPGMDPQQARATLLARINPLVSLAANNEPAEAVVARLREATGLTIQSRGRGQGRSLFTEHYLVSQERFERAGPAPEVTTGDWKVVLTGVGLTHSRNWSWRDRAGRRDTVGVGLDVVAPTTLDEFALLGLAPEAKAVLDGQELERIPPGPPSAPGIGSTPGAQALGLQFRAPDALEANTISVEGALLVSPVRERVLVIEPATPGATAEAEGVKVTLKSWAPTTREAISRRRFLRRDLDPAWMVEVTIERPLSRAHWIGEPGGFQSPEPVPQYEPSALRPTALALIAVETASGRRLASPESILRDALVKADRITFTQAAYLPALPAEPTRLLVALVDAGDEPQRLPYAFKDIELPDLPEP